MDSKPFVDIFLTFSVRRMSLSERDIDRCLERLTEEQMWQRGAEHENSIANLLQHLAGNMRQWILYGIDGQPDVRERDAEFALTPTRSLTEIREHFAATLAECRSVIAALPAERLLEIVDPQPGSTWEACSVLQAVMLVVGHIQLHTGQIILLTKQMVGTDLDLSIPRKR